ncbi:methyltransferase-like protein 27 isoform X2 [Cynoglossus semilaevis]|uniref:Methyltransferase like 27 n=2 Tax=Cynoglossus semilaevis TaxID=244447 RepID=A0A3P8WSF4_CYNSE|nr:methyltransferase-like protein 27 isoform X2 [Cynoglossus semilaevis]XP_008330757.1 methyltransferase-like protein 27 isoform X2 [Cynoglossus semilaevis]
MMSEVADPFERVKAVVLSCHEGATCQEKVDFYNSWAMTYEEDVAVLEYRAPRFAADTITSHFSGDREAAVVLDVACGTGLVAKVLKNHGFRQFVGIDACEPMLEMARKKNLYQDLKLTVLGDQPLPFQQETFDVVVMVGALSIGHVPHVIIRELCKTTKRGGYVCMTTRANQDNLEYKAGLEQEIKKMEDEGLWTSVAVTLIEQWERAVSEDEEGYIPGVVYLCQKL